jgi:tetratricopeptide (TPR) repeat protein
MSKKLTKEHLIKRAKKFYKKENYENCIKTCNKIFKLYPDFLEAYLLKLKAIYNLNFSDDSRFLRYSKEINNTVFQYIENSPKNEENYLIILDKIDVNDYQLKLKFVDEGLKLFPESNDLLMIKLRIWVETEEFEENMDYIDNLSKINKNWKNILYIKSNYYNFLDEYYKSLEVYDEILEYSEDFETITRKLKTLKKLRKDEEAFEILNKIMSENENWALVNKALYYEGNDNEEAIKIIDEVINNNSEYAFAYYGKASILMDMENYTEAEDYLNNALDYDENISNDPYFNYLMVKISWINHNNARPDIMPKFKFTDYLYDDSLRVAIEVAIQTLYEIAEDEYSFDEESDNDYFY